MSVVNEIGEEVLPKYVGSKELKAIISNIIADQKEVIENANEFFAKYPTFTAYSNEHQNREALLAEILEDEFYTHYFVATYHPTLFNGIIEATLLHEMYRITDAHEKFKETVRYMELYEELKQQPVHHLYRRRAFAV